MHLWPCRRCGPQEEGGVKGGSGLGESIIRESVPGDPPPASFWPSHTNSKHVYYVPPAALVHLSHRPREWRCGVLWGPHQWGLSAPANLHAESEREGAQKSTLTHFTAPGCAAPQPSLRPDPPGGWAARGSGAFVPPRKGPVRPGRGRAVSQTNIVTPFSRFPGQWEPPSLRAFARADFATQDNHCRN